MVFNATFDNISVISWRSILLVEVTGVPRENHRPAPSHWQTLSHNFARVHLAMSGIRTWTQNLITKQSVLRKICLPLNNRIHQINIFN